jgi:hypothetical protein
MPLEAWAAAGDPQLFAQVAAQARSDEQRTARVRALAERLGDTVVPHPGLTPGDRHAVLALRRRLHSGSAPGPAEVRLLNRLPAARALAAEAARLSCEAESASTARRELEHAVTAERDRVGALVWALVCASPVMRAFLDEADPEIAADISRRLAAGESWSGKRLSKRGAYLWRALGRAAAKTTPRGWAGQVAQLPVTPADRDRDGTGTERTPARLVPPGTALGALAAESVENVHRVRARLATLDLRAADPATPLATAPLHFLQPAGTATGPGVLRCWVIDPQQHGRLRQVVLRRTRPLERVLALLADGPRPLGDIEATLLDTAAIRAAVPSPAVLRGFLAHLLELGVLQVCAGPRSHATDWFTTEDVHRRGLPRRSPGTDPTAPEPARAPMASPTPKPTPTAPSAPASTRPCARPPATRAAVPRPAHTGSAAATTDDARATATAPASHTSDARATATAPASHTSDARATATAPAPHTSGAPVRADHRRTWFTDSYRTVTAAVPASAARHVRHGLGIAARVAWLREADRLAAPHAHRLPAELEQLGEQPCPLGDFVTGHLSEDSGPPQPPRRYTGWHPAPTPGSGYAGLLAHLSARIDTEQVDLDDGLLDALGAPPARAALPPWPLDCLLRPLAGTGPVAVLETASPAGVLDARFAGALHTLYGGYDNLRGYRAFLAAVERLTGARFVELLVPPLAERAANAVRRPVVTGWWTGDPDATPYQGSAGLAARHLPLERITLRRAGPQVVAEADGRRLLPVHHATRSPLPPYDVLVRLLLSAGHPAASHVIRLDGLAEAFPGAHRLPRVTVGGALVVSPAAWRVPRAGLWRPGDGDLAKVRVLAGLRRSAGLPRFAFVRAGPGARPVPVDFESLTAVPLLDRIRAQQPGEDLDLLVEEMLPGPGHLLLHDPLHGGAAVAAQLLLRLPHDHAAEDLAALTAAALPGAPNVPGTLAPGGPHPGRTPSITAPEGGQPCPKPWNSTTSTP